MAETIIFTASEISAYYSVRVNGLKQAGKQWRGPCPVHEGKNDNFVVNSETGHWYCHSKCGNGGDLITLERALARVNFRTAFATICRIVGRSIPDWRRLTREERWELSENRENARREQVEANHFAAAAIILAEQALEELDTSDPERAVHTRLIGNLRTNAVAIYRWWREHNSGDAVALVEAGRKHDRRLQFLLLGYITTTAEVRAHAC
jgi:DNA primase